MMKSIVRYALLVAASQLVCHTVSAQGPLGGLLNGGNSAAQPVQNALQNALQDTKQRLENDGKPTPPAPQPLNDIAPGENKTDANASAAATQTAQPSNANGGQSGQVSGQANGQVNGQLGVQGNRRLNANGNVQANGNANAVGNANANGQAGLGLNSQIRNGVRDAIRQQLGVGNDGTVRVRDNVAANMQAWGVQPNDQFVDSNGQPIRDLNRVDTLFQGNQELRVRRNGQIVVLKPSTSNFQSNNGRGAPNSSNNRYSRGQLGWNLGVRNNGVYLSSLVVNSIAAQAGLRAGDQIISVNNQRVGREQDVDAIFAQQPNGPATIVYVRNGQQNQVVLYDEPQYAQQSGYQGNVDPQMNDPLPPNLSLRDKLDLIQRLVDEVRAELDGRGNQ